MESALLLNATYEPIKVISWKKAITLMILGKAEVIEMQGARVHSAAAAFQLPSVLRLLQRVRVPQKPVQFSRANIYRRDGYVCQYCAQRFTASHLTFDHVLPRSRGGATTWLNIVTSCQSCNRIKGDRTPDEAQMPLLYQPREPRWWPFSHGCANVDNHRDDWRPYLWL